MNIDPVSLAAGAMVVAAALAIVFGGFRTQTKDKTIADQTNYIESLERTRAELTDRVQALEHQMAQQEERMEFLTRQWGNRLGEQIGAKVADAVLTAVAPVLDSLVERSDLDRLVNRAQRKEAAEGD